jgi:hypothetical protein
MTGVTDRKCKDRKELAEEAVWRNFSPLNSLLTGKNTGNFANSPSKFRRSSRYRPNSTGLVARARRKITGNFFKVSGN